ncbi:luciferase [Pseudonocardia sulfidoxydans NBRC 16205]|uniref:Luciferase n=1 Tax=Pseudonocardia sulfidoxydans NBRC 16205 TaxID=1223511 RepID=A0A511D8V4_9PSEU|nr:LLM class flavin-dependent oxidoreductase [Pseudonocardia sulfidoxydans]GEL21216.1 luciferase [Pseudonocardia sulfidoxydans NBRC 16205]
MEFGLFTISEKSPDMSYRQVVEDTLEQARVADRTGYDVVFLGEHHFAPYGTLPDTMVFAGAVSQATERIKIGTAVIVPAFQHPVRIAEQAAMLDVMSGGRFILGIGRGYQQREFEGFGVPQSESTARFREATEIIERLLAGETLTYEGRFWSCKDVSLSPKVEGDVPIYVAVSRTPENFAWAVEKSYGVMVGNPYAIDAGSGDGQQLYVDAQAQAGAAADTSNTWGLMNSVFVDKDSSRARDVFRKTWETGNEFLWKYAKVVEDGGDIPDDYKHYAGWYDWIQHAEYDKIFGNPWTLVGSPAEIVERLHAISEMQSKYGPPMRNYILWMNRAGCLSQKDVLSSIELFASDVMPHVRDL